MSEETNESPGNMEEGKDASVTESEGKTRITFSRAFLETSGLGSVGSHGPLTLTIDDAKLDTCKGEPCIITLRSPESATSAVTTTTTTEEEEDYEVVTLVPGDGPFDLDPPQSDHQDEEHQHQKEDEMGIDDDLRPT